MVTPTSLESARFDTKLGSGAQEPALPAWN